VWALGFVAALMALWLIVDPRTPDLAAQVYRVGLFHQIGLAVWDEHWYAGHDLPGYSLLFPPLGALLGIRAVGALAVLASTVLFERLARSVWGARGRCAVRRGRRRGRVGGAGDVRAGCPACAAVCARAAPGSAVMGRGRGTGMCGGQPRGGRSPGIGGAHMGAHASR